MQVKFVKKLGKFQIGDTAELKPNMGRMLVAAKIATEHKVIEPVKEEVEISPRTGLPKRVYQRRDMKADE